MPGGSGISFGVTCQQIRPLWLVDLPDVSDTVGLLLIGTFGLFGQEKDPLSAVFLIPLGLPWFIWVDGFPESLRCRRLY